MVRVTEADGGRRLDLTTDINRLEAEIDKMGDVLLVIIDPISAYLGDIDSHRNTQVRGVLEPLAKMSERTGAATVAVTHFNKAHSQSSKTKAIYRFIESIAFVAAARTAFVAVDDTEAGHRLFLPAKINIAARPPGLTYTIDGAVVYDSNDQAIGTSRLVWGEQVNRHADDAVAGDIPDHGHALKEAEDFLKEALKGDVEVLGTEIRKQAKEAGVAWRTVERARARLSITVAKEQAANGKWFWKLSTTDGNRSPPNGD
jgi:putative DNA primase/helicase